MELIIDYCEPKELHAFIKEQNISDIKFDKESQSTVFEFITDFFKSAYEENNFFGGKKENDVFINYLNYSYNFKQKILLQLKNICTVLTYFDFTENQMKTIYSGFNQFIRFTNFRERNEFIFMQSLINSKFKIIGYDLLAETLSILTTKNHQYSDIYTTILIKLKELNPQFINTEFVIENMKDEDYGCIMYDIPIIYNTLPNERKKEFLSVIENKLNQNFDTTIIFFLLLEKISLNKKLKNEYIETIHEKLETIKKISEEDYQNHSFLNPIVQYFELINLVLINDKKILSIKIEAELFKFIVNPEGYDKIKFDINWLKIFHYDSYIIRFSKIDYIKEKLEKFLIENEDKRLNKIYFKLLKNKT